MIRSTVLSALLRIGIVALLFCFWHQRPPGWVKNLFLFLAVVNLITIPFLFAALRQRVREIEIGELDEAKKY